MYIMYEYIYRLSFSGAVPSTNPTEGENPVGGDGGKNPVGVDGGKNPVDGNGGKNPVGGKLRSSYDSELTNDEGGNVGMLTLFMYICICIYVYVYIRIYTHVYIHICIHIDIFICIKYTYVNIYTGTGNVGTLTPFMYPQTTQAPIPPSQSESPVSPCTPGSR
jgi:hypothetical protein